MIIWDTGEYEVLPYPMEGPSAPETDDSRSEISDEGSVPASVSLEQQMSDSAKLHEAFQNVCFNFANKVGIILTGSSQGKIRLRLHGTRLPKDYTISLRMDKTTNFQKPIRQGLKRRRRHHSTHTVPQAPSTSDSESASPPPPEPDRTASPPTSRTHQDRLTLSRSKSDPKNGTHSDHDPDLDIQLKNAYPGSTNIIGSIHQRRWYLSLDRINSGFEPSPQQYTQSSKRKAKSKFWGRKSDGGFEPFHVHGPEVERSVLTGRLGLHVLEDEGVQGFVPRRGWRPVLH
jgi:hypothetical protein